MDKQLISKPVIENIYNNIKNKIKNNNKSIKLSIILIGDRQDSLTYVNIKKKKCSELGIDCSVHSYNNDISENIIIDKINELNDDISINGIMVQLPLPKHLNQQYILSEISINKDIDGLHPYNLGLIMMNKNPVHYPCTPLGCIKLLEFYNITIEKQNIVFIGSGMVNLPLSIMLLNKKVGSITLCNENTENIKEKTIKADILIVACGQPKMIKKDWIKENVIIIDIGINRDLNNKLCGDVDYDDVIDKVKYITPVPGGVGPMTVCMLINNLINNI
jgi:methylenetetrahydrofolate dehydrogenase (NADP+) / methenyltetrahydrofolate cyclohydrolase